MINFGWFFDCLVLDNDWTSVDVGLEVVLVGFADHNSAANDAAAATFSAAAVLMMRLEGALLRMKMLVITGRRHY